MPWFEPNFVQGLPDWEVEYNQDNYCDLLHSNTLHNSDRHYIFFHKMVRHIAHNQCIHSFYENRKDRNPPYKRLNYQK